MSQAAAKGASKKASRPLAARSDLDSRRRRAGANEPEVAHLWDIVVRPRPVLLLPSGTEERAAARKVGDTRRRGVRRERAAADPHARGHSGGRREAGHASDGQGGFIPGGRARELCCGGVVARTKRHGGPTWH